MTGRRLLALALLAAALPFAAAHAATDGGNERAVLTYAINLGGLEIGTAEVVVTLGEDVYAAEAQVTSAGLFGRLMSMTTTARSTGAWTADGPRPTVHRSDTLWRGERRSVELEYGPPDDAPRAEVLPPPSVEEREPVPEGARAGTVDPMSGILALMSAGLDGDGGPVPIYDGRRMYTLDLGTLTPTTIATAAYDGTGWRGTIGYERKYGAWRGSPFRRDSGTGSAEVEIAPGSAFGLPLAVPARVQVDTFTFGGLVVLLTDVRRLPPAPSDRDQTASTVCETC
ncbi:DUF3108 domain-containing protein [Novispirillum sp. DQ9]|uniref:DUF3108 domain-containing protein n=1 Tax=Novispirillum sp. DQ9 TaxID=3398612 RepID=UPI003C7E68C2